MPWQPSCHPRWRSIPRPRPRSLRPPLSPPGSTAATPPAARQLPQDYSWPPAQTHPYPTPPPLKKNLLNGPEPLVWIQGDRIRAQRRAGAQPRVTVRPHARANIAAFHISDDEQSGTACLRDDPFQGGVAGRAVSLEERHLQFHDPGAARRSIHHPEPELAHPRIGVGQTPLIKQRHVRVNAHAEPPVQAETLVEPVTERTRLTHAIAERTHPVHAVATHPEFCCTVAVPCTAAAPATRASEACRCASYSCRLVTSKPARTTSSEATAAATSATVVNSGMSAATAAARISSPSTRADGPFGVLMTIGIAPR